MANDIMLDIGKFWKFLESDKFATKIGVRIDAASLDSVRCSLPVTDDHLNANGVVQGGAIFTLADFAFAAHCNIEYIIGEDDGICVGQSCNVVFLKPASGKRLVARTSCLSKGRTMSVFRVTVENDAGAPVAEFMGNAFRVVGDASRVVGDASRPARQPT